MQLKTLILTSLLGVLTACAPMQLPTVEPTLTPTPSETATAVSEATATIIASETPEPVAWPTAEPGVYRVAFFAIEQPYTVTLSELDGGPRGDTVTGLYLAEWQSEFQSTTIFPLLTGLTETFGLKPSPDGCCLAFTAVLDDSNGSGSISYAGGRGDTHHIYIYHLADKTLTRIGELGNSQWAFDWSPDGTQLAYGDFNKTERKSKIYIVDLANSTTREVDIAGEQETLSSIRVLSWSPDGGQLAIRMAPGLKIFDLYNNTITYLTQENTCSHDVAWSPDSRYLAFTKCQRHDVLYMWDRDTNITNPMNAQPVYGFSVPDWSPNGQKLLVLLADDGITQSTAVMDGQGQLQTVMKSPIATNFSNLNDRPMWSPDGNWILTNDPVTGNGLVIKYPEMQSHLLVDGRDLTVTYHTWLP